jgi:restriction system protein
MAPLLRHFADGREHKNHETVDWMARELGLSEEEKTQPLPSGRQTVFANRVAWAKAHFKRAGLLEATALGVYRITERGRGVQKQKPKRIDLKFLDQFPGHREFRTQRKGAASVPPPPNDVEITPQEHIEVGYQQIRDELATSLLLRVKQCPPEFFEKLVVDLLLAMGYGGSRQDAGRAVGKAGDGGIDGIIKEDRLGLDVIYIQAKRWEGVVGRPELQKFAGALQGQRARKGIFITTSSFTKEAREYAGAIDSKLVLIDGDELSVLMIDHGIGVADVATYAVKRLDSDYFEQE